MHSAACLYNKQSVLVTKSDLATDKRLVDDDGCACGPCPVLVRIARTYAVDFESQHE